LVFAGDELSMGGRRIGRATARADGCGLLGVFGGRRGTGPLVGGMGLDAACGGVVSLAYALCGARRRRGRRRRHGHVSRCPRLADGPPASGGPRPLWGRWSFWGP